MAVPEKSQTDAAAGKLSLTRQQAQSRVAYALRVGRIKRHPCEICGDELTVAHHDDYSDPLNVRWMCRFHHSQHHAEHGRSPGAVQNDEALDEIIHVRIPKRTHALLSAQAKAEFRSLGGQIRYVLEKHIEQEAAA